MSFKEWLISEAKILDIPNYVKQSIDHIVEGEWEFIATPRNDVPSFRYQWRLICELHGRNVKMEGDKYYLKFFVQCFKKPEWAGTPPKAPEGYFGGSNWWGPSNSYERHMKELQFGGPFEKVTDFDPKKGHPLVRFQGFIEGWRPGMMPDSEIDYKLSADIKGYPIPVSRPGDFRHDMERIGEFSYEEGDDQRLNTPYEVAKAVKEAIDRFHGPRNDDDDEEPIVPPPTPSGKVLSRQS